MLTGYFCFWGPPQGIVSVEKQFEIDLINPATGAASKTYSLAGKWDAACLAKQEYLHPVSMETFAEQTGAELVGPSPDESDASEDTAASDEAVSRSMF
jgi:hypothetical protein